MLYIGAACARAFTVGASAINFTVPADSEAVFSAYITVDFDGEFVAGRENIPFIVDLETISTSSSYIYQEAQLTFFGNPSLSDKT